MPEVTNTNQNDNVSAFDSILNKYSALLIEVDKLKDENANIKAESSQKINVDLTKVTAEQFFSKIDSALNEIKKEISQINIVLYILIAIISLLIFYFIIINRLRSPFGYLVDNNDSPLVDFRYIQRSLFNKIFYKNVVHGKDLGISEINNIVFKFSNKGVLISPGSEDAQIRVNNQPIIDKVLISENSWIGIGGNLYSFKFSL